MMDEEGEQFVTYFLPAKETIEKRARDIEDKIAFDPDYMLVLCFFKWLILYINFLVWKKSVGN